MTFGYLAALHAVRPRAAPAAAAAPHEFAI
jgi:hypothetical protein